MMIANAMCQERRKIPGMRVQSNMAQQAAHILRPHRTQYYTAAFRDTAV